MYESVKIASEKRKEHKNEASGDLQVFFVLHQKNWEILLFSGVKTNKGERSVPQTSPS